MTDELKTELERISKEAQELKSALANTPKAEEIKALSDKIEAMITDKSATEENIQKLADQISKISVKPVKEHKSFKDALAAALEEKAEEISMILKTGGKGGHTLNLEIETKSAIDMGTDNTIGSGSTQNLLTQNTGIISTVRSRELTYAAHVSVGSIGTSKAMWVEELDEQGDPIFIGEGDAKTKLSVKYVEQTMSVRKIAVYGKVTTEMLADLPQFISYITNNLAKRLDIEAEDQLVYGDGTGDNPKGINEYATAFSAGALAGQINDANELDVIEAIALQVKQAHGVPNTLYINPATMAKIKLIKDAAHRPVWKDYVTINGTMNVSGMDIIESKAVTAGDFIGGDTSVVHLLYRENLSIQVGLDGNDFTQNKQTILLEKRLVQFVSANDTPVLVKGDFASAITALGV